MLCSYNPIKCVWIVVVLSGWVCFHAGCTASDMAMLRRGCDHASMELCVVASANVSVCVCVSICLSVSVLSVCQPLNFEALTHLSIAIYINMTFKGNWLILLCAYNNYTDRN